MEQEKIRELLGKYFRGETGEDEEQMLRDYLRSPSVPASLADEFGYLAVRPEKVPEPSEGFEAVLDEVTRNGIEMTPRATRRFRLAAIGASVAAAAGLWLIFSLVRTPQARDTYSDPALAMAEVESILLNVSERMNTGTAHLEQVKTMTATPEELTSLTTINGMVGRNLSRLRYLGDLRPGENKKETE